MEKLKSTTRPRFKDWKKVLTLAVWKCTTIWRMVALYVASIYSIHFVKYASACSSNRVRAIKPIVCRRQRNTEEICRKHKRTSGLGLSAIDSPRSLEVRNFTLSKRFGRYPIAPPALDLANDFSSFNARSRDRAEQFRESFASHNATDRVLSPSQEATTKEEFNDVRGEKGTRMQVPGAAETYFSQQ